MRVAGLGFRRGVRVESLEAVLALVGPFDALATAAAKADEPGLMILANRLNVTLHAITPHRMAACARPGEGLARAYGTGSVAESAALAAAGHGARLVVGKVKGPDGMAVAAVAEAA